MNLIGLSMVLVGSFANFGFNVPSQKAITPIVNEWQCSNCGWHSYEGTEKCYYCGAPR